jgi:hypothetical protein
MIEYKVITWNFSTDRVEHYDIMPYLYRRLEEKRKKRQIVLRDLTLEKLKEFIDTESKYQFWARCQYEVILSSWPPRENGHKHKMDVYEQIHMNLDNIAKLMYDDLQKGKSARATKTSKHIRVKTLDS